MVFGKQGCDVVNWQNAVTPTDRYVGELLESEGIMPQKKFLRFEWGIRDYYTTTHIAKMAAKGHPAWIAVHQELVPYLVALELGAR